MENDFYRGREWEKAFREREREREGERDYLAEKTRTRN